MEDGHVASHGPNTESRSIESEEVQDDNTQPPGTPIKLSKKNRDPDPGSESSHESSGKLISAEEIAIGRVSWQSGEMFVSYSNRTTRANTVSSTTIPT